MDGCYAGARVPGLMMLIPMGENCGLEECNSSIDNFILKSGLKEAEFPKDIYNSMRLIESTKPGYTIGNALKSIKRCERFEMELAKL